MSRRTRYLLIISAIGAFLATYPILKFATLPFAWAALLWFFACLAFVMGSKGSRSKAFWLNLGIIMFLFGLTEVYFYATGDTANDFKYEGNYNQGYTSDDEVLGYGPVKASKITSKKLFKEEVIYDVSYAIGPDGLRISPPRRDDAKCVLFFGCSFAFGEGLHDEETIAYQVGLRSSGEFASYNFAFHGYGPHQMLAALEAGRVAENIQGCTPRYVIYETAPFHVLRAAGKTSWDKHGPRYVLDEKKGLILAGHFDDSSSPLLNNSLMKELLLLGKRSLTWKKIFATNYNDYNQLTDNDVDIFIGIVNKANLEIQHQFPGAQLHILLWDRIISRRRKSLSRKYWRAFLKRASPCILSARSCPDTYPPINTFSTPRTTIQTLSPTKCWRNICSATFVFREKHINAPGV